MPNPTSPPPSMWPTTLARRLGVHPATVTRWCVSGRIAAWRTPGGRWRIKLATARELLHAAGVGDLA